MIFTVSFSVWPFGWNLQRKLHKEKGEQAVERAWTFYVFIFKELSFPTGQKKEKTRGAAGSCLGCEMFVLCSAVAPWQRVLNWLQMCEESKGVVCVPAGAEGARPLSLPLIGTTCPPEQGGNHSLSVLLGWFSIGASSAVCWGVLNKGTAVAGNSLTSFTFL